MDLISHQAWDKRVVHGHFGHQQRKQQTQHQQTWPGRKCICFADSFCSCLVCRDRAVQNCWGLEINVFFWVLNRVCAVGLQKITATRTGLEWKCERTVQESGGELCVCLCGNASLTGGIPAEETATCCYSKHSLLLLPDCSGNMWMPDFSCLLHCGTGWHFCFL